MKRALAVSVLVLCLVACSDDAKIKKDKDCIDPNTYANICLETALREQEVASSAYLDHKFSKEDKQFEFNQLPVEEQKTQVANGTAPTVIHHHSHSGSGFITGMILGHMLSGPSNPPMVYRQTAPVRPLGPSPAPVMRPVVLPMVRTVGAAVRAPIARFFPSSPKPTVKVVPVRVIQRPRSYVPAAPVPTPKVWSAPKVAPTVVKPTPAPAPKPSWSAPKAAPAPSVKSWSAPRVTPSFRPSFGRR